jgi:uncharacterized protein involved in response to NO
MEIPLQFSPRAAAPRPASGGLALWNLGFRPFYLLASLFAAISLLLWVAQYSGLLPYPYLAGPIWHGHEMLFGFASAVIAGFLLTAVAVWTQQPPLRGTPLVALALLWLAARILVLTPFATAATVTNALFPLAVATAIAVPLARTRNYRNVVFIGLLSLLGALALLVHLASQGLLRVPATLGLKAGLDVVLLVMVIIAGRVVPMFTNNGVPGAKAKRYPMLERVALGSIGLLLVADLLQWDAIVVTSVAVLAALAHGARLVLWQPWRTFKTPLVWILHAAYAWIVLHLALRGLAGMGWVAPTLATHALTVGAIGGLTLGMMTRTARGHTGRPLKAGRAELMMFILIQFAAAVRLCGGLVAPEHYMVSIQASGLLWGAAFLLYAVRYWPVLTKPRLDGKPG